MNELPEDAKCNMCLKSLKGFTGEVLTVRKVDKENEDNSGPIVYFHMLCVYKGDYVQ